MTPKVTKRKLKIPIVGCPTKLQDPSRKPGPIQSAYANEAPPSQHDPVRDAHPRPVCQLVRGHGVWWRPDGEGRVLHAGTRFRRWLPQAGVATEVLHPIPCPNRHARHV
jgi:hypothetical protein